METVRIILASLLVVFGSSAATTNQISLFGVTFYFSNAVEYGYFAGGVWPGVVGPVTITNITPAWDGQDNGFQVNCPFSSNQAFDTNVAGFSSALLPSLPLTLSTNSCVVKAISYTNNILPAILSYSVLTVVTAVPPSGWINTLRPSIAGTTNRPLYTVWDIQTNLLPALPRSVLTNHQSLATTVTNFGRGVMNDFHSYDARRFRDAATQADYQPENGPLWMNALFSLFLDDPWVTKSNAVVNFLTIAMDRMTVVHQGYQDSGTGHNPGHRIIAAFAATMLNVTPVLTYLSTNVGFHEDNFLQWSPVANRVLWGQFGSTDANYWNWIMTMSGSRSHSDPYGYIDGGNGAFGGGEYQVITSQYLKGEALAGRLMPSLTNCFAPNRWYYLNSYAERWVTNGGWLQPDPAAPYDGTNANYLVTFGSDGMGGYIPDTNPTNGVGRFPTYHATNPDGGQYRSLFVADMWNNFADSGGGSSGGGGSGVGANNIAPRFLRLKAFRFR